MSRGSTSKQEDDGSWFEVELHCSSTGLTEKKTISLPALPHYTYDVKDIKMEVEKEHNIPVCVQTLSYDSQVLTDKTKLDLLRARSGDTFHIAFLSEGDCEEIVEIIGWFGILLKGLKPHTPSVTDGINPALETLIAIGIETEVIEDLAFKYFFPWLDKRKYVNKLHFVYSGGLDTVFEVYERLLKQPWSECLLKLKFIEYGILRILWNLTETFPLRRLVMKHRGIEMCIQSLLRQELEEGAVITDTKSPAHPSADWLLIETIVAALGTLCNLSEVPECHIAIASNTDALMQLTCISLSPSVKLSSAQLVATLFLCLANTTETHANLAHPVVIRRLLDASRKERYLPNMDIEILMLKYFTLLFLAQIVLMSPQYIPTEYYEQIVSHIEEFLKKANHKAIMEGEIEHWYVWSTFLPYIKLMYIPEPPQSMEMSKLRLLSTELVIFSLLNMLGRENHRKVLVEEGLVDYVTCMPLYVPPSLRGRASELVEMLALSEEVAVQPPTLVSLTKGKLAKMHFGLDTVLKLSVGEIIHNIREFCGYI